MSTNSSGDEILFNFLFDFLYRECKFGKTTSTKIAAQFTDLEKFVKFNFNAFKKYRSADGNKLIDGHTLIISKKHDPDHYSDITELKIKDNTELEKIFTEGGAIDPEILDEIYFFKGVVKWAHKIKKEINKEFNKEFEEVKGKEKVKNIRDMISTSINIEGNFIMFDFRYIRDRT